LFGLGLPLLLALGGGCQKRKKARVSSIKVEPLPPQKPKRRGKKYPEQITDRDPNTLLGGERGLDHVGVAVKDLAGAQAAYRKLGFSNPQAGKLPNGLRNANFHFGDTTYLELVTVYDEKKNPWIASFIKRHEKGAMFLMLCVFSYGETANVLRRQGFKVGDPLPGRVETKGGRDGYYRGRKKPPMWHTFTIDDSPLPGNITFIAYNRGLRNFVLYKMKDRKIQRRLFSHENTALGLKSAWIAVKSAARTARAFEKAGLKAGRKLTLEKLDARAREIEAGQGTLLLLQPRGPRSPVAAFLKKRGEGIIGLGFEVARLDTARSVIEKGLALSLEPYDGPHGRSVLVPAPRAFDVWIEFFQR
jgi:hypothetical protein